jgi:hypothetical protein
MVRWALFSDYVKIRTGCGVVRDKGHVASLKIRACAFPNAVTWITWQVLVVLLLSTLDKVAGTDGAAGLGPRGWMGDTRA